eukprot:CAMPEP_0183334344 /NCGR_PEP_ID=MMETSP0164_2-20130417/2979_1 /TAXON_ID=221442 /ORGANISM="Coccolithus pelagicus ssp braarudi, Strain PLY182g" /LENGTH=31 /DNA_ID= /DNA_START= /DNA_END= /DNA_ORIENTATION=
MDFTIVDAAVGVLGSIASHAAVRDAGSDVVG